jgi:hypothetical protein
LRLEPLHAAFVVGEARYRSLAPVDAGFGNHNLDAPLVETSTEKANYPRFVRRVVA